MNLKTDEDETLIILGHLLKILVAIFTVPPLWSYSFKWWVGIFS